MKRGVYTSYLLEGVRYGSYIICQSEEEAYKKAKERGLGEIIESLVMEIETIKDFTLLSDEDFLLCVPEILHQCCFLAFLALKRKVVSLEFILGDLGVLHELSHLNSKVIPADKETVSSIRNKLFELQKQTVGLF